MVAFTLTKTTMVVGEDAAEESGEDELVRLRSPMLASTGLAVETKTVVGCCVELNGAV